MISEVLGFLDAMPSRIVLYESIENIISTLGSSSLEVKKSQISWGNPLKFAFLSLPCKAAHKDGLILTFGLNYRVEHPRIFQSVEAYPNRWTHHVLLQNPIDVDDAVHDWLKRAYEFSHIKRKNRDA